MDVLDLHWFGTADGAYPLRDTATGQDVLARIRVTLAGHGFPADLPLWITEIGSYSGDPVDLSDAVSSPQTERQQAGDYFKRFLYPLRRASARFFLRSD